MRVAILTVGLLIAIVGSDTNVYAGADGVDTHGAAMADKAYRGGYGDGLGATSSGDYDNEYSTAGNKNNSLSQAYKGGWLGGLFQNGIKDALHSFFEKALQYERRYTAGWDKGNSMDGGSSDYGGDHTGGGAGPK